MISVLSKSPSVARLAGTDILLQFTKQPCQKCLSGFSSRVTLRSCSLYLVFCLALKWNNSSSTNKELFLIGQKTSSIESKISALKRYSFTIAIEIFLIISYIITSISKIFTVEGKRLTLYSHDTTPKSEEITPGRQTFTSFRDIFTLRRKTLTPKSETIADERHSMTSNSKLIADKRQAMTSNSKVHTTLKYSVLPKRYTILSEYRQPVYYLPQGNILFLIDPTTAFQDSTLG